MKSCPRCRQPFAEHSHLCPRCSLLQDEANQVAVKGGIKGAILGLLVGLAIDLPIVLLNELNRNIKGIAFILPVALLITGFMLGMLRASKE